MNQRTPRQPAQQCRFVLELPGKTNTFVLFSNGFGQMSQLRMTTATEAQYGGTQRSVSSLFRQTHGFSSVNDHLIQTMSKKECMAKRNQYRTLEFTITQCMRFVQSKTEIANCLIQAAHGMVGGAAF